MAVSLRSPKKDTCSSLCDDFLVAQDTQVLPAVFWGVVVLLFVFTPNRFRKSDSFPAHGLLHWCKGPFVPFTVFVTFSL